MTEAFPPDGPRRRPGLAGGVLTILFVAVASIGGLVATRANGAVAEVGNPAPALAFTDFDGETFDLVEHIAADRGPVLLNLWASWCEPCRAEFPVLSDFTTRTPGVTVVAVAVQEPNVDDARAFAAEMQPSFRVGHDADGTIRDSYPSFGLPATFLIGRDGIVVDIVLAELTTQRLDDLAAALEG